MKVAEEYLENSAAQKLNRMRMLAGSQQQANATKKPKTTHPETLPTDSKPTVLQVEYPPSPSEANQPPTHKTVPPAQLPTPTPKPYAAKPAATPA
eukprot:12854888-Ditylum_brightwellii.AAC.1